MFKLSRGAEYAIRSVLYLSMQPEGKVCLSEELSKNQDIPHSFLPKVLQSLSRSGIVKTNRGAKGGVSLLKHPRAISMYDVIVSMEGEVFLNDCLLHNGFCPRDPVCSVHFFWKDLQKDFRERMERETFENLVKNFRLLEAAQHHGQATEEKEVRPLIISSEPVADAAL